MEIKEIKSLGWLTSYEAYEIYKQCIYNSTFSEYINEIKRISKISDYHIFVCAESSNNKGIIILKSAENDSSEIIGIAVEKKFQKSGIGKYMVFSAARSLNIKTVFAETDDEAVGFYEHIGFITEAFVRHFSDGAIVRYKCQLSFCQNTF